MTTYCKVRILKKFPWKSSFLKLPSSLQSTLDGIDGDLVKVAATKSISRKEIADGLYAHVGLRCEDDALVIDEPSIPPVDIGKWSGRNALGWDNKRKDWPKVHKTWTFEAPNFGDGARNGWSMRSRSREVYQHQIFEPQGMTITNEILDDRGGDKVLVKFEVSPILSRTMPEFDLMLLWSINVLQENTGVANVFSCSASHADFLETIALDWMIFPSGTVDEVVAHLKEHGRAQNQVDFDRHVQDRIQFFESFKPVSYVRGLGGFGSYFGAKFSDNFVVFENLKYGNAIYLLYENWEEVSKRSRLDLLRDSDANFDRVMHSEGWQLKLKALMQDKLHELGLGPKRRMPRSRRRGC